MKPILSLLVGFFTLASISQAKVFKVCNTKNVDMEFVEVVVGGETDAQGVFHNTWEYSAGWSPLAAGACKDHEIEMGKSFLLRGRDTNGKFYGGGKNAPNFCYDPMGNFIVKGEKEMTPRGKPLACKVKGYEFGPFRHITGDVNF